MSDGDEKNLGQRKKCTLKGEGLNRFNPRTSHRFAGVVQSPAGFEQFLDKSGSLVQTGPEGRPVPIFTSSTVGSVRSGSENHAFNYSLRTYIRDTFSMYVS